MFGGELQQTGRWNRVVLGVGICRRRGSVGEARDAQVVMFASGLERQNVLESSQHATSLNPAVDAIDYRAHGDADNEAEDRRNHLRRTIVERRSAGQYIRADRYSERR
jgi:hypothetical protein